MPELVYLSTLLYIYTQIIRKKRSFEPLNVASNLQYLLTFILENILCLVLTLFMFRKEGTTLSTDNINLLAVSTNYLLLMFIHCLVWRRKGEQFINPMIINDWWNVLSAIGTAQFVIILDMMGKQQ